MSKYIIKNCPACYYYASVYGCEDNHDEQGRDTYCEKISDCLLKQIVEKLKEHPFCDCSCGDDILSLLDINEVEE